MIEQRKPGGIARALDRDGGQCEPGLWPGQPGLHGRHRRRENGDNITATYSCSATAASPAGTYPIVPSLLDPDNLQTNYQVTLVDGTLTVLQTASTVAWTNPAPITYGTALSSVQLNATASVPGSFAYSPTNGAVLNTGTNTLSVIFTPADTTDYTSVTGSVSLVVLPAPLTVTAANASRVMARPTRSSPAQLPA